MNKMSLNPTCYRFGSALLLFSFLITGCAGSHETRYDDTTSKYILGKNEGGQTYTNYNDGVRYTIGQYDDATAHYILGRNEMGQTSTHYRSGDRYTIGQHDSATARYTLKQGSSSGHQQPRSDTTGHQFATNQSGTAPQKQLANTPIVIEITDILFDFDKSVIKKAFYPELDEWAGFFQNNPAVTAEIYGHADSTGPTKYNQNLSERRAQAVINYLAGKGIDPKRLTGKGFGETLPTALNTTDEGRQKNRRVELGL